MADMAESQGLSACATFIKAPFEGKTPCSHSLYSNRVDLAKIVHKRQKEMKSQIVCPLEVGSFTDVSEINLLLQKQQL